MAKETAQHHHKAAEHHEHAARHHREAAKHYEAGNHEKAAHHAHLAHGHHNMQCTMRRKVPSLMLSITESNNRKDLVTICSRRQDYETKHQG
jgi:hypothetical protein